MLYKYDIIIAMIYLLYQVSSYYSFIVAKYSSIHEINFSTKNWLVY